MLGSNWWARIVEDGIGESYVFDATTFQFKLVNRQARQNLGYDAAEVSRMTPWHIKPRIPERQFRDMIAPLVSGEHSLLAFETVHQRKDGSQYDVSVRLQLLRSEDDAVFFAAIEDITAQRRAEEQLRQTSDRLDAIVNNTRMALFMMDDRQRCIFMNAAAEEMTGFSFAETQGRVLHDVIHHTHPDGRPFPLADCAIDRAFPENNQQSGEEVFVHKDGSFYPVGFTASPLRNDAGDSIGTVIEARLIADEIRARETMRDYNETLKREIEVAVTQRKQAEVQLFQAQKMEAIGNLTGGVAHDFNNILQVVKGNLDLLTRNVVGNETAERRIQHAMAGVSRGAKLTSQLLAFARRQPLEPSALHLGRLLHGLDDMLRRTLGEAVEIEIVSSGGLWNCNIDRAQIENAILNLAINARDAMENRGKLTLEVSNAVLDDHYASDHADVTAGQYVMLAVTDTGCGMTPETLAKVFEPFFSTKPEGEGTGLGLSMVYGFVRQSGGHVKLYSEVGVGTTVRLYLPRTRLLEEAAAELPALTSQGGAETILVVEDDESVRATAVELLTDLGYRVLTASNADSALAIVESGVAIDLLFTDVVMPGNLRSTDLARLTIAAHPSAGVLFTSGYTQNAIVHAGRLDEGVELLSKPYGRDNLARKIRQVLERRPAVEAAAQSPQAKLPPRKLAVLAVEDEVLIQIILSEMLSDMGYSVTEAGTIAEAKAQLAAANFDVLVTDVSLPDGSGIELAIDARLRNPGLRLVIASGRVPDTASWPAS
ncbi:PAS domain S-box protein [Sandarakinorhabdus sp. DWP1-3-1]|uniref:PAS domain S-box protein n=1 Tax=Sandarakinorhabdus sp. DWP1-3-1 TaxID=2804627 RepID=UPI003CE9B293